MSFSFPREAVVKQGDHIVKLLQERLSETAAADGGDPLAFLAAKKSREAVREGVRMLDKGHDNVLGGWGGGRGGMKFPQVVTAAVELLLERRFFSQFDRNTFPPQYFQHIYNFVLLRNQGNRLWRRSLAVTAAAWFAARGFVDSVLVLMRGRFALITQLEKMLLLLMPPLLLMLLFLPIVVVNSCCLRSSASASA